MQQLHQKNTQGAFDAVANATDFKYSVLGPSIMVTDYGDVLVNHDDLAYASEYEKVKIRNFKRENIESFEIPKQIDNVTYPTTAKYMFFDEFLDRYLANYQIYLDIKNRVDCGVTPIKTATTLINMLVKYKKDHELKDDFWNKLYFDCDNPLVISAIVKYTNQIGLKLNCMYDYNNMDVKLFAPRFWQRLIDCISSFHDANMVSLDGPAFATQDNITRYVNQNKKVVVWNMSSEDIGKLSGISFALF